MDGKNISLSVDMRKENSIACRELAAELVRLNVDVIVTAGPAVPRRPRKQRTRSPSSWHGMSDPVGSGFIDSLARPGGNITGLI